MPSTVEERIRSAYATFERPGQLVRLADLRPLLADIARADVDGALDEMITRADVWILGEEDQKHLTRADRAAAVEIGAEPKYYIAIGAGAS